MTLPSCLAHMLELAPFMTMTSAPRRSRTSGAQTAFPLFHLGDRHLRPTGIIEPVAFTRNEVPPLSDGAHWSAYIPRALAVAAPPHPTPLLAPSVQRAIRQPLPNVPVRLDRGLIQQGILSREQLELVARALTAHSRRHVDEHDRSVRCGFLLGFGTGSGKTSVALAAAEATRSLERTPPPVVTVTSSRLIAGVFQTQGHDLGIPPDRFGMLAHAHLDTIAQLDVRRTPYLLATYATLRRPLTQTVEAAEAHLRAHPDAPYASMLMDAVRDGKSRRSATIRLRFADVLRCLLPDDTLWIFDECDALRELNSDQGHMLRTIDAAMPDARMLFLSATPIPNAKAFKYLANRLGLAGPQAMYPTSELVAAAAQQTRMAELLIAEGVSLGTVASGGLSFEGVTYSTITVRTTDAQRAVLDQYQAIVNGAVVYAKARLERYSRLTFDEARFPVPTASQITMLANRALKTIVTDMCRPALFDYIDEARARHESIVIELARTGEAQRQAAAAAEGADHSTSSGKHLIRGLIELLSLPVNVRTIRVGDKAVLVDRNPERTAATTSSFVRALNAVVDDDHVLTDLATRYGSDFAEITGRSVRTVRVNGALQTIPRSSAKANAQAIRDFADGRVHAVAVSEAGSRGIDLHAGATFANREKRNLLVFDPFLRPAEFAQVMGRVCRTGQVSWPNVVFFTTDIPALSANLGTVVAKMREAGACTYGERDSIAIRADTLVLNAPDSDVINLMAERMKADSALAPFHAATHRVKRVVDLVRWIATMPSCDRYPLQQRLWHTLTTACETIQMKELDQRTYPSKRQVATPTTIGGCPAVRLQIEEPYTFVRDWNCVERETRGADVHFLETARGITCAIRLPRYGNNPQEYRLLRVDVAHIGLLPDGTPLSRDEARARWQMECDALPQITRNIVVALPPFGPLRAYDEERSSSRRVEPLLDDRRFIRDTHVFVDAHGSAIFGLYLDAAAAIALGDGMDDQAAVTAYDDTHTGDAA